MCAHLIVAIIFFSLWIFSHWIFVSIQDDFQTSKQHFGQWIRKVLFKRARKNHTQRISLLSNAWCEKRLEGCCKEIASKQQQQRYFVEFFFRKAIQKGHFVSIAPFSKPFTFSSIFKRHSFRIFTNSDFYSTTGPMIYKSVRCICSVSCLVFHLFCNEFVIFFVHFQCEHWVEGAEKVTMTICHLLNNCLIFWNPRRRMQFWFKCKKT